MRITSEPKVIPSFRGLVAVVETDLGILYIGAKSLMKPLMKLVELNGGKWTGIWAEVYKDGEGKYAPYVVKSPLLEPSPTPTASTEPSKAGSSAATAPDTAPPKT